MTIYVVTVAYSDPDCGTTQYQEWEFDNLKDADAFTHTVKEGNPLHVTMDKQEGTLQQGNGECVLVT